jgi:hypothetical protein
LIAVSIALIGIAAPSGALAHPPAVDEYAQHLPDARGDHPSDGTPPVARPQLLPPQVRSALSGPDGRLLAQIATAPELGAPTAKGAIPGSGKPVPGIAGDSKGVPGAALDAVGSGPGIALLAALGAIGVSAFLVLRRRSRAPGSD